MKRFITLLIICIPVVLLSQEARLLEQKARDFLENEEYIIASTLYDSLLMEFPDNPLYLSRSGESHLKAGNIPMAIKRYRKAYSIDNSNHDLLFQLGNVYDMAAMQDSAIFFFNRYIDKKPGDVAAYNRLAIVYMSKADEQESAIEITSKALEIDPDNSRSYYIRAMSYLNLSDPVNALFAARKGIEIDSGYALLYMPLGIANMERGDYEKAFELLEKGRSLSENPEIFTEYSTKARVLKNTSNDQLKTGKDGRIYFSKINTGKLDKLIKETRKEKSEYYYPDLLRKFNDHSLDFSLDEFLMLYLGFTTDKNYSPYFAQNEILDKLWEEERYEDYLDEASRYVLEHPVSFHIYLRMASIARYLGAHDDHYDYYFKYKGFSQALLATGTGDSEKDALVICYPWHENTLLSELGYEVYEQFLIKQDDEIYERVTGVDPDGLLVDFYFNITIPYRELERALEQAK